MDKASKASLLLLIMISIGTIIQVTGETFVDAFNRSVYINSTRRVISLSPALTETLAYFEMLDNLIAVDQSSLESCWYMNINKYLESKKVESVGGYWGPGIRIEKILELQPDLVLADMGAHKGLRDIFDSYNITVFFVHGGDARSLDEFYSDIRLLGRIFNKTERAEELIRDIEDEIVYYRNKLSSLKEKVRVLLIVYLSQEIWVVGKDTYLDDLLSRMGLVNVVTRSKWTAVSIEEIYRWNPDLIIVSSSLEVDEDALRASGLLSLNKTIVIMNKTEVDILSRPGPLLRYAPSVIYNAVIKSIAEEDTRVSTMSNTFASLPYLVAGSIVLAIIAVSLAVYITRRKG